MLDELHFNYCLAEDSMEQTEKLSMVLVFLVLLFIHKDELSGSYALISCFETAEFHMCGLPPSPVTHLAVGKIQSEAVTQVFLSKHS